MNVRITPKERHGAWLTRVLDLVDRQDHTVAIRYAKLS